MRITDKNVGPSAAHATLAEIESLADSSLPRGDAALANSIPARAQAALGTLPPAQRDLVLTAFCFPGSSGSIAPEDAAKIPDALRALRRAAA